MKYNFIIVFICLAYLSHGQSISSSVISPTGASFKQQNFGLHFSVGEPLNTIIESSNGMISQGVLQMPGQMSGSGNSQNQAAPQITCPTEKIINICAPIANPAQLSFASFEPFDDATAAANIAFEVNETVESITDFTVITQQYVFTDEDGNSTQCEVVYNIANEFRQQPEISQQAPICEGDLFSGVKFGGANYMVYADNGGLKGNLVGVCDQPGLLCPASALGINSSAPGSSKLWITEFITFPDGSVCESTAAALNLDVIAQPTARLSNATTTISVNETINLMEFVSENNSGYWTGDGVISVSTSSGERLWIFSPASVGTTKLYYTVSNQLCKQSYLLVVNTAALIGDKSATINNNNLRLDHIKIFPNPIVDYLTINLNKSSEAYQMQLFDINGALLRNEDLQHTINKIDLRDLNAGTYMVQLLKNGETEEFVKVVKQ